MALYDPNEFPETETVSLGAAMLAWAKSKPADEKYNYCDPRNCAVAQFGRETGRPDLTSLSPNGLSLVLPGLEDVANPLFGKMTFGAFAKRLESALV